MGRTSNIHAFILHANQFVYISNGGGVVESPLELATARLQFRLPSGRKFQRRFHDSTTIADVHELIRMQDECINIGGTSHLLSISYLSCYSSFVASVH